MRKFLVIAAAALPLQAYSGPPAPPAPRIVAPATPRAAPQAYIGPEDYPASALRQGEQGLVGFVLDVGANGRVERCTIRRSSGSTALDSATCRLMRSRARFTPAMDSNGNPAPARVVQEVFWVVPGGPLAQGRNWGQGVMVSHVAPPPVVVAGPPLVNPPVVAIPQDGPGEADLSVWDARTGALTDLGRYRSIPDCRKVKSQLRLRSDQRAWCTVAAENLPPRP